MTNVTYKGAEGQIVRIGGLRFVAGEARDVPEQSLDGVRAAAERRGYDLDIEGDKSAEQPPAKPTRAKT